MWMTAGERKAQGAKQHCKRRQRVRRGGVSSNKSSIHEAISCSDRAEQAKV